SASSWNGPWDAARSWGAAPQPAQQVASRAPRKRRLPERHLVLELHPVRREQTRVARDAPVPVGEQRTIRDRGGGLLEQSIGDDRQSHQPPRQLVATYR